jgi:hypothetical protein
MGRDHLTDHGALRHDDHQLGGLPELMTTKRR